MAYQIFLKETADFIEQYKKEYDVDTLEPEGLIISIAYQYLLNQGWDKKTFWECEDKNNLGIDLFHIAAILLYNRQ